MVRSVWVAGVAWIAMAAPVGAQQLLSDQVATDVQTKAAGATDEAADTDADGDLIVNGRRAYAGTKTDTPLIEVPQPITVISEQTFRQQGAINIADTVRYAASVNADAYGRDTRVDSFTIRGVEGALQLRDGMRDIFSYYASTASDPYNFSRVEILRGPASVLFGQGSIGGVVNLVSKTPGFTNAGELQVTYGRYDRKEVLGDLNLAASDNLAGRVVVRARDADTYVDNVSDARVMVAPSVRWQPTHDTDVTLLGLYQKDNSGSTANFLPIVGTLLPNGSNPSLDRYLFVGRPGYDRYDGRLWQGTGLIAHSFGDRVKLNLRARYIDSDVSYFTHYTDSYSNPTDPYEPGSNGRRITLYADSSLARLNVFSTDNNLLVKINTGAAIEHTLLGGVDYSWNRVRKVGAFDFQTIDLYNIDRDAILAPKVTGAFGRDTQKQLGFYLQDQIRLWDRVSIVLAGRHDRVRNASLNVSTGETARTTDRATTFRAGIIGEVGAGFSPFFNYTESFLPQSGSLNDGTPFRPQRGTQYEAGVKWQPQPTTLVTATAFRITENNRIIYGPGTLVSQSGEIRTKGLEVEATHSLPDNVDVTLAYGYNDVGGDPAAGGYLAKHVASAWTAKSFVGNWATLRLGAGVRYTGKQVSISPIWTIVTPDRTMVDALVEITRDRWRATLNATNLFNNRPFANCLARGDCFITAPRNVMASLAYHF